MELLFYSPLEQFEFALISGKVSSHTDLYMYDLLHQREINLSYADVDRITGTSFHRDSISALVKEADIPLPPILEYIQSLTYGFNPFRSAEMERESRISILLKEIAIYAHNKYWYEVYIENATSYEPIQEFVEEYLAAYNESIMTLFDIPVIKNRTAEESLDIVVKSYINDHLLHEINGLAWGILSYSDSSLLLRQLNCLPTEFVRFIGDMNVDMYLLSKRDYSALSFYWLNIYNSLFIVITLIILIFIIFNQGYTKVLNVWQILNTLTFDFLLKSFISLANKNLLSFFPVFFGFFIFIYFLNLTALTPFSFCITSNLWFSLSLSFSVWFGVTALAIIVRGKTFFTGFVPSNISSNELKAFITVIEVISYVARALSLGVRIFANMLAGHSLVHILSDLTATCFVEFDNIGLKIFGIFPAIILSFILVIEFGICFLQGLVFVILTAIYLKEAFEGH